MREPNEMRPTLLNAIRKCRVSFQWLLLRARRALAWALLAWGVVCGFYPWIVAMIWTPELTQAQVFRANWPMILACVIFLFTGLRLIGGRKVSEPITLLGPEDSHHG